MDEIELEEKDFLTSNASITMFQGCCRTALTKQTRTRYMTRNTALQ